MNYPWRSCISIIILTFIIIFILTFIVITGWWVGWGGALRFWCEDFPFPGNIIISIHFVFYSNLNLHWNRDPAWVPWIFLFQSFFWFWILFSFSPLLLSWLLLVVGWGQVGALLDTICECHVFQFLFLLLFSFLFLPSLLLMAGGWGGGRS